MLAYQIGDEKAFTELYDRYASKIYGYLRSKVLTDSHLNDLFQSTFLKLHKSKHLYNSSLPFSPWIFTICRNELIDFFRKQKFFHESFDESTHAPSEDLVAENNEFDISQLSQEQQSALKMRYYDDATFEEIAAKLNTSPSNARQIVSRSIKYLRGFYEK